MLLLLRTATACNKRRPDSGCDAITGVNRIHAVLGTSDQCIATHPSDVCVALAALAATIRPLPGKGGFRPQPKPRGDPQAATDAADVRVDGE